MQLAEHIEYTTASAQTIWRFWEDVANWPQWDPGLEQVSLEGSFKEGAQGSITPEGASKMQFTITKCDTHKRFDDETKLFGARLLFTHTLTPTKKGLQIYQRVDVKGILAWFYALVLGRSMRSDMPISMKQLKEAAEKYEK